MGNANFWFISFIQFVVEIVKLRILFSDEWGVQIKLAREMFDQDLFLSSRHTEVVLAKFLQRFESAPFEHITSLEMNTDCRLI